MKINATVFVDRLIGPFVDDALKPSTKAPARKRSRQTQANGSQQAGKRRKKPETEMLYDSNLGDFIGEALGQSAKTPAHNRSRNSKAKAPKKTASRKKKPGSAPTQAHRRKRKTDR